MQMLKFISALLSLILFAFTSFPDIIAESKSARAENIQSQKQRIIELSELYGSADYSPVNESEFAGFDIEYCCWAVRRYDKNRQQGKCDI